jgi:hypothetical protein
VVLAPTKCALRVVAGPGSGKTRVLTTRVANLLREGLPPWQVSRVSARRHGSNGNGGLWRLRMECERVVLVVRDRC